MSGTWRVIFAVEHSTYDLVCDKGGRQLAAGTVRNEGLALQIGDLSGLRGAWAGSGAAKGGAPGRAETALPAATGHGLARRQVNRVV